MRAAEKIKETAFSLLALLFIGLAFLWFLHSSRDTSLSCAIVTSDYNGCIEKTKNNVTETNACISKYNAWLQRFHCSVYRFSTKWPFIRDVRSPLVPLLGVDAK